MSRVHDMGGRYGDGPVEPDDSTEVFHEDWHARALAVTLAAGGLGQWNLDMSRHARECLSPHDYMRLGYYEKWLAGLADLLVAQGVVTEEELTGVPPKPSKLAERALQAQSVAQTLAKGGPADRKSDETEQFTPGDAVRTSAKSGNRFVPGGHTRLPTYAAGANGRVLRCHGAHVLPDSNAHGLGERPEPLYSVAFPASELWPAPEHPDDEVVLDLWQSYLEPA